MEWRHKFFTYVAPVYDKVHVGGKSTAERVLSIGDFRSTDVVVDLGGGTGRISSYLKPYVHEIIVVDASDAMLRQCRDKKGLSCVRANAENIPLPDETIDKVVLVDSFHHFFDQERSAREISRILRKGGRVIIQEIDPNSIIGIFVAITERVFRLRSRFMPINELSKLLDQSGIKTLSSVHQGGSYYLVGEKCSTC